MGGWRLHQNINKSRYANYGCWTKIKSGEDNTDCYKWEVNPAKTR